MFTSHLIATVMSFLERQKWVTRCRKIEPPLMQPAKIEDMNSQAQLSAAHQLAAGGGVGSASIGDVVPGGEGDDDKTPELEAAEDDEPVDETGVDPKDIDLVMGQVNCSRAKAVRVLREHGGDIINASESFTVFRIFAT